MCFATYHPNFSQLVFHPVVSRTWSLMVCVCVAMYVTSILIHGVLFLKYSSGVFILFDFDGFLVSSVFLVVHMLGR